MHVRHRGGAAARGFWNSTASGVFPKMFPGIVGNIFAPPPSPGVCVWGGGGVELSEPEWGDSGVRVPEWRNE